MSRPSDSNVTALIGLTLTEARQEGRDRMILATADRSFLFYHSQDCCESVGIEEIAGDLAALTGSPITRADEEIESGEQDYDHFTKTTFRLATAKGAIIVRWLGTSNGYYSESVSFVETTKGQPDW